MVLSSKSLTWAGRPFVEPGGRGTTQNSGNVFQPSTQITTNVALHETDVSGKRHFWGQMCETLDGLAHQVTDPAALFGMVGAGLTYKVARFGLMSAFQSLGGRGTWVRQTSSLLAFGGEASLFPIYTRVGNQALGRVVDWSPESLNHSIKSSFLILGGLKLFGAAATSSFNHLHGVNPLTGLAAKGVDSLAGSRLAFQQAGMFTGILSGHEAEQRLGLQEAIPGDLLLAQSLVTLLHFNAAGYLIPVATGRGFQRAQQDIEGATRELTTFPQPTNSNLPTTNDQRLTVLSSLALATVGKPSSASRHGYKPISPQRPLILQMSQEGEGGGSGRKADGSQSRGPIEMDSEVAELASRAAEEPEVVRALWHLKEQGNLSARGALEDLDIDRLIPQVGRHPDVLPALELARQAGNSVAEFYLRNFSEWVKLIRGDLAEGAVSRSLELLARLDTPGALRYLRFHAQRANTSVHSFERLAKDQVAGVVAELLQVLPENPRALSVLEKIAQGGKEYNTAESDEALSHLIRRSTELEGGPELLVRLVAVIPPERFYSLAGDAMDSNLEIARIMGAWALQGKREAMDAFRYARDSNLMVLDLLYHFSRGLEGQNSFFREGEIIQRPKFLPRPGYKPDELNKDLQRKALDLLVDRANRFPGAREQLEYLALEFPSALRRLAGLAKKDIVLGVPSLRRVAETSDRALEYLEEIARESGDTIAIFALGGVVEHNPRAVYSLVKLGKRSDPVGEAARQALRQVEPQMMAERWDRRPMLLHPFGALVQAGNPWALKIMVERAVESQKVFDHLVRDTNRPGPALLEELPKVSIEQLSLEGDEVRTTMDITLLAKTLGILARNGHIKSLQRILNYIPHHASFLKELTDLCQLEDRKVDALLTAINPAALISSMGGEGPLGKRARMGLELLKLKHNEAAKGVISETQE